MPGTHFLSGYKDLSANGTGTINIKSPVSGRIVKISFASDGAFRIDELELTEYADFWDGTAHRDNFKENGNVLELPEPIPIRNGQTFIVKVTDLSGSANTVYCTLMIVKE